MASMRRHLAQANDFLETSYPEPQILYAQRGASAGTAWLEKNQIRLNPVLLLENEQAFIDEVVPHELAHLLVWSHFGRVPPHGKEWRWMMESVLGVPASRTHSFDLSTLRPQSFLYHCDCQPHQLTIRRHNRVMRGETQYRCRQCGALLRPDPAIVQN
ncbi:protein SprT [Salmonella enterica subsp. enterica serovar Choleraesuis]|nr:protein SprT [Salmonella enterica subsp. enterica serovar Choleraesuis]